MRYVDLTLPLSFFLLQVFFKQALAIGKIVAAAGADDDVEVVRGLVDAQFGQVRVSGRQVGGKKGEGKRLQGQMMT